MRNLEWMIGSHHKTVRTAVFTPDGIWTVIEVRDNVSSCPLWMEPHGVCGLISERLLIIRHESFTLV